MSQTKKTSRWGPFFVAVFVAATLTLLGIGWFRTESRRAKWITGVFISLCGGLFTYATIKDWLDDRRLRRLTQGREALDPETFGGRYFSELSLGPEVAATVRRLLDEHLQRELGGLRPEDALDYLRDWIDPLFLDELARRLEFTPPPDCPAFRDFAEPLRTIRDLVEAVTRKVTETRATKGPTS